jgi:tRNA G18 (ribose-2'-O)-methylase SpoU
MDGQMKGDGSDQIPAHPLDGDRTNNSDTNTNATTLPHLSFEQQGPPRLYLVIVNIGKFQNVWNMVQGGLAFGCTEIFLVGQAKNSQRLLQRAGGGGDGIPTLRKFGNWKACVAHMQTESILLIGVEIDERGQTFNDEYFQIHSPFQDHDNLGILLGNEGQGILPKFLKDCSSLIRIPQYGSGTASLNVNVACSIVLHRFSVWKQQRIRA